MNVNAISSTNFTSRHNYNRNPDKVTDNNDGTVTVSTTVSKTRFEKARRAAARGITAAGIAAIMLSGSGCSKSDGPCPIDPPVEVDDSTQYKVSQWPVQKEMMKLAKYLGKLPDTNVPALKFGKISNFGYKQDVFGDGKDVSEDEQLLRTYTMDEEKSNKDSSVYVRDDNEDGKHYYSLGVFKMAGDQLIEDIYYQGDDSKKPTSSTDWGSKPVATMKFEEDDGMLIRTEYRGKDEEGSYGYTRATNGKTINLYGRDDDTDKVIKVGEASDVTVNLEKTDK